MEYQAPSSVTQIEHVNVIAQLYGGGGVNPQYQKSAQEFIHNFQKQTYAWDLAPQLLASQSVNSQFIGAHTFQVKISRDWNTLSLEKKQWLRRELLEWIVRLSNGANLVITKLCLALTAYAIQAVPDIWTNFIPEVFEMLHNGAIAVSTQNPGQSLFIELPLLEFLTVVPEEVMRGNMVGDKKAKVHQELTDSTQRVLSTLKTILSNYQAQQQKDILIKRKGLKCLQSWILYGVPFESLHPLIDDVINLFPFESTYDEATEVLIELLSSPRIAKYQDTVCEKILRCMTSEWAKNQITAAIHDGNEMVSRNLCRLITTFGDNFSDYVAIHFLRQDIIIYLEMMIMFIGFPGYFGQDQEISEMPLQFWYVLQESLFDPGVIPVNGENISGSKMVSLEEAQKIREASIIVFQRLLEVVRTKVQYPPDDEWAEWAKDVKDRFRVYRRDVGDTVLYAYYVLRNQMFAYLVELAIMQLSMPGRDSSQWQDLESTLFCLKSISEAVDHKENRYLPRLFGSEVYGMLPVQGSSRLRNTALSLIGSYAEWLKRHPEYIFSALNYLVSGLSDPETSSVSALSFKEVCDTCRESLVNEIDSLINMYMVVGPHIQTREKQRVIESIADVIQALPPEKKMEPLLIIANSFIGNLREAIIHGKQNPSPYREAIIIHLEYLTCCGRGIQPPDDEVIIIDDDDVISKEHILSSSPSPSNLSNALTEITGNVAEIWCQDNEVMECLCKFLNTGIRVTENLLSIPFEVIISLVQISYLRNPFSCWLDTAAQVVTVFGPNSRHGPALRNMLAEITTITIQQYVRNQADMENNPDLVNSYFAILTKFIQKCPLLLYNLPPELFNNIMKFSVVGLSVQERLALKSAITFMGEFVGQHYEDEQLSKGIENIMMTYGMEIMRELISGIGGKLPRSFVVSLSHVLHKITSRYVEASKEWLSILLNQENFPSHHADLATKQHFAKSILGTRSIQKYKEIVTNFSIKCRALGDTAYGYA